MDKAEDYAAAQIDNLVRLAMKFSGFVKLAGIKDVYIDISAMMALQTYIVCDNGDVIQLIYEIGSCKIYATLIGLHCSNDAHIPVCRNEIAREKLIHNLMNAISMPVLSSDPKSCYMEIPYAFLNRGHVVYYLKCVHMDIQMANDAFRGLIKDVLHKHKDGVLLDIANVKVDRLPKEIKEEWVLC